MLYHMEYDITVGAYKVQTLKSVTVKRSVEQLSDTAQIAMPGTLLNAAIEVEDKIKVGDPVKIQLGYKQTGLKTEFEGYLKAIKTEGSEIVLECEDALYMWRTAVKNEEMKTISLQALLNKICQQVNQARGTHYNVQCDYAYSYDKFVFSHATALDVLKKVQDETKANIYFDGETLHLHPQYSEVSNDTIIYDYAINVCASELKYVKKADKNVKVVIEMTNAKGKKIKKESGVDGGIVIKRGVTAAEGTDLQKVAENEYNLWCYDGYEGNLTGWLVPYCKPTDKVEIRDSAYPQKTGTYYVVATDVEFSESGGRRKVTLGKRLG